MKLNLINLGNGHAIVDSQIKLVLAYGSRPTVRMKQESDKANRSIDLTGGEKVKSLILIEGGFLILSSFSSETIQKRCKESTE